MNTNLREKTERKPNTLCADHDAWIGGAS